MGQSFLFCFLISLGLFQTFPEDKKDKENDLGKKIIGSWISAPRETDLAGTARLEITFQEGGTFLYGLIPVNQKGEEIDTPDGFKKLVDEYRIEKDILILGRNLTKKGTSVCEIKINGNTLILQGKDKSGAAIKRTYTKIDRREKNRPPIANPEQRLAEREAIFNIDKAGGEALVYETNQGKRLVEVKLQGNLIKDSEMVWMEKLADLDTLYLAGSEITDAGLGNLKSSKNLSILALSGTKITNKGLKHLQGLTALNHLDLDHTEVSDPGLAHLKYLKNLIALNLNGTKVTDKGLEHLTGLPKLRHLFVVETKVTSQGVRDLKKKLHNLDVHE